MSKKSDQFFSVQKASWINRKSCSCSMQQLTLQIKGGDRNFQKGADAYNEGAKIGFSGYYKCQKSPKTSFSLSDGGYSPL